MVHIILLKIRTSSSPVKSYLFNDNGVQIVVNVTMPEHPLFPGYVARIVENGKINNYGEGSAFLQAFGKASDYFINDVWNMQNKNFICECTK